MKQMGTVLDYCRRFEEIATMTVGEREDVLSTVFLNGLRPEIKAEVKLQQPEILGRPNSLTQISVLAQRVEERNSILEEAKGGCSEKQFQIVFLEGEHDDPEQQEEEEKEEVAIEQNQSHVELSISSVVGIQGPKTMNLKGSPYGKELIVLIDSGASHNFIGLEAVGRLELLVVTTPSFRVRVGDGYRVTCQGECKAVLLELQGMVVVQDFFSFEMGSTDVVLRMAWLETLGETGINWKKQTMKFKVGERMVQLRGDPSLSKTLVSLKAMIKIV
ncbi:uncharacterized protein LOC116114710 [Pistacia vera]|uniref:uncharacterized protein LOC116114710 n=1 Tax=Pistacia vera TaxID=55513 RepID=UPI001263181A|nr:uncharacterized protein LOC116114710 [Pistacia vera]